MTKVVQLNWTQKLSHARSFTTGVALLEFLLLEDDFEEAKGRAADSSVTLQEAIDFVESVLDDDAWLACDVMSQDVDSVVDGELETDDVDIFIREVAT